MAGSVFVLTFLQNFCNSEGDHVYGSQDLFFHKPNIERPVWVDSVSIGLVEMGAPAVESGGIFDNII